MVLKTPCYIALCPKACSKACCGSIMDGMMSTGLSLTHIWCLLTDVSGRLVGIAVGDLTGQCCWAVLGDFPFLLQHNFSLSPHENQKALVNFLPRLSTNQEVRGQVKNLEGLQLFSLLRLWVTKVLQSTISAPVSPLLSQRKGIQQGLEGPSQSPVAREMGVSLTTMDKCLMTSRQCTLAPHCYHDRKKCFHKHM